jgi:hypothetical protein
MLYECRPAESGGSVQIDHRARIIVMRIRPNARPHVASRPKALLPPRQKVE